MAHYAQINSEGIVQQVLVMDNDLEATEGQKGCIDWLQDNVSLGTWIKTSYNGNIRKQYAGIGHFYDSVKDKFISPSPFPSWVLNDDDDWIAPTPAPDDGKEYEWQENTKKWVEVVS
jgi:hypothetical protein|tara:strand:+ start:66 stop:416 length:351 start_codon:yes stop_codon:yes gene_type:complete